ncbi:MAG: hypothetical protein AB1465_00330 [Patescibacteria group bacterium]
MAKEGSSLAGKNIWNIRGRTLLNWLIDDARKSSLVNKVFVSTNGKETAQIAERANVELIIRSDDLAKNENFPQAVDHAINYIKQKYDDLQIITISQCVVPFRAPDIFDRCISFLLKNKNYDSVVTIRKTADIPETIMKEENGYLMPYFSEHHAKSFLSRQDSQAYGIDHVIECFRYSSWLNREKGIKPWSYLGRKIKGIEQDYHNPNCFVDVHTLDDIRWLEFLVDNIGFEGMKK